MPEHVAQLPLLEVVEAQRRARQHAHVSGRLRPGPPADGHRHECPPAPAAAGRGRGRLHWNLVCVDRARTPASAPAQAAAYAAPHRVDVLVGQRGAHPRHRANGANGAGALLGLDASDVALGHLRQEVGEVPRLGGQKDDARRGRVAFPCAQRGQVAVPRRRGMAPREHPDGGGGGGSGAPAPAAPNLDRQPQQPGSLRL